VEYTLAYCDTATIIAVKSCIVLAIALSLQIKKLLLLKRNDVIAKPRQVNDKIKDN